MGTFAKDLAGELEQSVFVPASAAGDSTAYIAAWAAPHDINLVSVHYRPVSAVTGAATNSRNLNLDDGGTAGNGTTELGNVDFASGTDAAAGEAVEIYAPTDPVAYNEGNLFKLESEQVGTGLALPAGVLVFRFRNN